MKEKYLLDIKNAMFLRFGSEEIRAAVEDANLYYESALENGIPENEIIQEYGTPKEIAANLRGNISPAERARKKAVTRKFFLLACCLFCQGVLMIQLPLHLSLNFFVLFCSILIWFLSGSDCTVHVLTQTDSQRKLLIYSQFAVIVLFIILQMTSLMFIPHLIHNTSWQPEQIGSLLRSFILLTGTAALVYTIILYAMMQRGNIYLFFPLIQNIAILCGIYEYYIFLQNQESLRADFRFVFVPYLTSLVVLAFYGMILCWQSYCRTRRKEGR